MLLAYCGLAWLADACEVMLLSFLGPAVRCAWGVGPAAESALTSVVFATMLFGVTSLGAVADQLGRRRGFLLSALILGGAGLASALAPSFGVRRLGCLLPPLMRACKCEVPAAPRAPAAPNPCAVPLPPPALQWLLLLRGIVGYALGGTPIAVTLFAEFCTSGGRGRWVLAMQGFWTVGTLGWMRLHAELEACR